MRRIKRATDKVSRLLYLSIFIIGSLFLLTLAKAAHTAPQNFLFYSSPSEFHRFAALAKRTDIGGVQIVYNWNALEKGQGQYDFSQIENNLSYVHHLHKKLFIQIQDRFFEPQDRNIPTYLLKEPQYGGGLVPQSDNPGMNKPIGHGWATQQWNPTVRTRYQQLLAALAKQFDGRVMGINLPETALDIDTKHDSSGFSCDKYFQATLDNLAFAKKVFRRSYVVQYVNFWPCEWNNDHRYMSRIFAFAKQNSIGLGGPDIVPGKREQMKNSYPFFHRYKDQLTLVAMAVQQPTLTYLDPHTGQPFTRTEFIRFAQSYLGANIIFWSVHAPWLKQN